MAIVERRRRDGSIAFQVKVRDAFGKWFPTASLPSELEAKTEELRLLKLKASGAKVTSGESKQVTMNEYWDIWSVENRGGVSAGWRISQDQTWRDHVQPVIGKMTLAGVDVRAISRVMSEAEKKGLGAQSRVHIYNLLKKMFSDAIEYYEMLSVSPVRKNWHRAKILKKARSFHTPAQAIRVMAACRQEWVGPAIWVGYYAGLRSCEIQGLQWDAVDLDARQIVIRRAYNRKLKRMQEFPKQGDFGRAPIVPALAEYLRARQGASVFVCPGPKGGMLVHATLAQSLTRFCGKAGVHKITPHELRHSCTELFVAAGASEVDVQRLLNHKSSASTHRYMHRTDERLSLIADNVGTAAVVVPKLVPNGNRKSVLIAAEGKEAVS